jgi:hypothetical protein
MQSVRRSASSFGPQEKLQLLSGQLEYAYIAIFGRDAFKPNLAV